MRSGGIKSESLTSALMDLHAQLHGLLLYTQYPLKKRQDGPQSWSRCSKEMKNILVLLGIEPSLHQLSYLSNTNKKVEYIMIKRLANRTINASKS
jgi:hypothetical protein